jgi:hypothetical protein
MSDSAKPDSPRRGIWDRVKSAKESLALIAALVGSAITIGNAFPIITRTATYVQESWSPSKPTNLAAFVSDDQPFANQYLTVLAERGFKTRFEPYSELDNVVKSVQSGILIVHKDHFAITDRIELSEATRARLRKHTKIIGIGSFGAYFIRELDAGSMLGSVMHATQISAALDDAKIPSDVGQGLSLGTVVDLYDHGPVNPMAVAAAYDFGSPERQSPPAQGIARLSNGAPRDPCKGAHWTVALQGNFALWGYQLPAAAFSKEGRQLFGNLAVHLRDTPYVDSDAQSARTEPKSLQGRLGCGLTNLSYRFRPTAAGPIRASVVTDHPIALILNAPFRVNAIARQDGTHPQVSHQVSSEELSHPGDWRISLAYFGQVRPETNFGYQLQLDYPYSQESSLVWLIAAGAAFVIGLLALGRLAFIFVRTTRPPAQAAQS